jgi:hypothetical protein
MDVRSATLLFLIAANCRVINAQIDLTKSESPNESAVHDTFLVLLDGQIKSGRVTPRPDGYDIQVPGGRIYINSDRVRFAASSLPEAYDRMRESLPELTPANHLGLARWCLSNKLYTQARREVLDALYLDPNREDAKRMLQALEQIGQDRSSPITGTGLTEYPSQVEIRRPAIESRALAGLNRSVAHSFVRDVQPLLMNKCATSGCHGKGTRSQFELISTHRGSTPAIAERNLAAVLKQVDFSNPASSPLLRIGEQAHGNIAFSPFQGRAGAMQMKTLLDWVEQASYDIAPEAVTAGADINAEAPDAIASNIRQVSAIVNSPGETAALMTPKNAPGNPHARQLTSDETDEKFLRAAKYANRHDAFSPDNFNLRFHGRRSEMTGNASLTTTQPDLSSDNENIDARVP